MRSDAFGREDGFTLIETMTSLSLFALVAAAISCLLVSQMQLETSNSNRTTAISLAAKELESIRALDYPSIPASRSSTTTVRGLAYTVASNANFNNPASGMARITTTVSWAEPGGAKSYAVNVIYTDITR